MLVGQWSFYFLFSVCFFFLIWPWRLWCPFHLLPVPWKWLLNTVPVSKPCVTSFSVSLFSCFYCFYLSPVTLFLLRFSYNSRINTFRMTKLHPICHSIGIKWWWMLPVQIFCAALCEASIISKLEVYLHQYQIKSVKSVWSTDVMETPYKIKYM